MDTTPTGLPSLDLMPRSSRTIPLKVLLALTIMVLLAHLALLRAPPLSLGLSQSEAGRAFMTRTVDATPAVQAPVQRPITPPAASRRATSPHSPAKAARPKAAEILPAEADATAQPPVVAEEPASPVQTAATPENTSTDEPLAEADQPAVAARPPRDPAPLVSVSVLPGAVRIKYKVDTNKFPYSLNAELLLQQSADSYEARLEFSALGQARVQTSNGQITSAGLTPIRFSDKYRSEVAAHFEWGKGKVTFSANTPDVPLLSGAQDRLSVLVQLAAMIASDPDHYPQATTLTLQIIGPRDADTWLFTVERQEMLTLPGGEQATLKLVRNPRREFDQKVELWLAPALGYLPARIRITESNGDFIDQKWFTTEPQV